MPLLPTLQLISAGAFPLLLLLGCPEDAARAEPEPDTGAADDSAADSGGDTGAETGADSADDSGDPDTGDSADTGGPPDADGDGHAADVDCLDTDPSVHPGAVEVCNDGLDNDCDGGPGDCAPAGGELQREAAARYLGTSGVCGDEGGAGLAGLGDADGDGFDELVVGAPAHCGDANGQGAVYVVYGSATPADRSLGDADAVWRGEAAGDNAGAAVAGVGDVDADGVPDLLVGAPGSDAEAAEGGAAYLLLGGSVDDGGPLSGASARYGGPVPGALAGAKVAGAGDVDGDGRDDFLVAGYAASTVWLVRGEATPGSGSLDAGEAYVGDADLAGWGLAGAGDVDGDGLADVILGAQNSAVGGATSAGAAFLVLGDRSPRGGDLSAVADAVYTGDSAADYAGLGVAGLGDFTGDGRDDLVVSAPYDVVGASVGSVYLIPGAATPAGGSLPTVGLRYTGEADDYTGISVAGPGDVDGDGFADLLVGAFYLGDTTGGVWWVPGGPAAAGGALAEAAVLYTGEGGDFAGGGVVGAGDADGDGRPDFAVAAAGNELGGSHAGAVYLIAGVGL